MRKRLFLQVIAGSIGALLLGSCEKKKEKAELGLNSEAFYQQYNRYISTWLAKEKQAALQSIEEKKGDLGEASDDDVRTRLESSISELERLVAKYEFRESLGDYFAFKDPTEIPPDLKWEDGMEQPDIGDPAAKKGGIFRYYWPSFPPTVRQFGTSANNGSRGDIYDLVEVWLVHLHPVTGKIIPGVAKEWAVSEDGRTTFFRLDPEAKFNDGHPIEAEDILTWARLRLADQVDSIYWKQYIREQLAQLAVYDTHVVSVTLPEAKPREWMPYKCGDFAPAATHFYKEFGPDFEERYQWVVPPTTSSYQMLPQDLVKGNSLTLTRVDDWWLKDRKFYRYRYNADKINYRVVRNSIKAWELFRAGELDYFPISLPDYYYNRSEMPAVFDGYVERTTWYNQYPRLPWGLSLNTAEKPLNDKVMRRGIAYASNWGRVLDDIFRGDASRLPGFTTGFGELTNPNVKARDFSVTKARRAFAEAGYTREDEDGILMKEDGERLEISLTFTATSEISKMMVILKEEAKKAGLNFVLDGRDNIAAYSKAQAKEHQAYFSAWGFVPPEPHFYEFFHSRNAFDEKGNRKANTNNIFSYADERMDGLVDGYRSARSMEELKEYGHKIQEILMEEDLFVPGFMTEFLRVANWRWVRWPDVPETRFSPPLAYIPMEGYCYWIDQDMKEETLAAMRKGAKLPEVERIVDDYRDVSKQDEQNSKEVMETEELEAANLEEEIEE